MSSTPLSQCAFCTRPCIYEGKCNKHWYRLRCSVENCPNQTYARYLCVLHGGKQRCRFEGCQSNARCYGLCCKHGTRIRKLCKTDGCEIIAHARGLCVRHGGGRKCKWTIGCTQAAQIDGYCLRHYEEIANPDLLTNEEVVILSTLLKDVNIDSATDEEHFGFAAPDGVDI